MRSIISADGGAWAESDSNQGGDGPSLTVAEEAVAGDAAGLSAAAAAAAGSVSVCIALLSSSESVESASLICCCICLSCSFSPVSRSTEVPNVAGCAWAAGAAECGAAAGEADATPAPLRWLPVLSVGLDMDAMRLLLLLRKSGIGKLRECEAVE